MQVTNGPGPDHSESLDARVLCLAPTSRDGVTTEHLLRDAGIELEICQSLDQLTAKAREGAGVLLLPEEAVATGRAGCLAAWLATQPPWSDLPVLVLTRPGADSLELHEAVRLLGNVTLLERPVRVATLLSAISTALRARMRQYQIRGHLAERARAEQSLRRADRRKDEFLATLGHELRNPLAPLVTGLQLLKTAGPKDSITLRVSSVMERQINHLIRLVDDLLEVSRITRNVIELEHESLDLREVLRAAVDTVKPAMDAAGHAFNVTLPADPLIVRGDAVRLTQVVVNLLTNATKYTDAGGSIWLRAYAEGEAAIISVRDDGIGIAPAHLESVFDMFTQVDRSNRRTQGGLGIGLTLARSLVSMHGGHLVARSDGPGTGSEFVVTLPMLATAPARAESPSAAPRLRPQRVLVVDDNCDAADTLGAFLESQGATVSVVHSGQEALDRLAEFPADSVLLDIGMPGLNGYETARAIRARPGSHELLVALTGWGQEEDIERSHEAGFDEHLIKPVDLDQLQSVLSASRPSLTAPPGR